MPRQERHWRSSNSVYDYESLPRVEHYYEAGETLSYCGMAPLPRHPDRQARRKCNVCIWFLVLDGKARVILPR